MKQVPYGVRTNIRRHRETVILHCDLAPGICAPLLYVYIIYRGNLTTTINTACDTDLVLDHSWSVVAYWSVCCRRTRNYTVKLFGDNAFRTNTCVFF